MNESVQHDPDVGECDHGFGDVGAFLIVFGQTAPPSEPPEGSFDQPAAGNEDEAATGDTPDDDQRQPEQKAGEDHRHPIVDAVGEDGAQPAVEPLDPRQQRSGAVGVLDVGGVDEDPGEEARGVDGDVTLAALDLLGRVKASGAPFSVVLTLWVSRMAAEGVGSRPSCSRSIITRWWQRFSHTAGLQEGTKVAVDSLPGRKGWWGRQMAPLATCPRHVKQGVKQSAHVCATGPPAGLGRREKGFDLAVLVIAQRLAGAVIADQAAVLRCHIGGLQQRVSLPTAHHPVHATFETGCQSRKMDRSRKAVPRCSFVRRSSPSPRAREGAVRYGTLAIPPGACQER